jgi:hypothetical protein
VKSDSSTIHVGIRKQIRPWGSTVHKKQKSPEWKCNLPRPQQMFAPSRRVRSPPTASLRWEKTWCTNSSSSGNSKLKNSHAKTIHRAPTGLPLSKRWHFMSRIVLSRRLSTLEWSKVRDRHPPEKWRTFDFTLEQSRIGRSFWHWNSNTMSLPRIVKCLKPDHQIGQLWGDTKTWSDFQLNRSPNSLQSPRANLAPDALQRSIFRKKIICSHVYYVHRYRSPNFLQSIKEKRVFRVQSRHDFAAKRACNNEHPSTAWQRFTDKKAESLTTSWLEQQRPRTRGETNLILCRETWIIHE